MSEIALDDLTEDWGAVKLIPQRSCVSHKHRSFAPTR
jgi:hypothetical protein